MWAPNPPEKQVFRAYYNDALQKCISPAPPNTGGLVVGPGDRYRRHIGDGYSRHFRRSKSRPLLPQEPTFDGLITPAMPSPIV
jgi:hypothetical protein